MFWNRERTPTYGYHLKPIEFQGDDALIKMDDGWNGYASMFPSDDILVKMTAGELAEHAGLASDDFQQTIDQAIRRWRVNPAGSLINIIKDIDQGSAGQPMFSNIRSQSQVIAGAILAGVVVERNMIGVWGGKFRENSSRKTRWQLTGDYCAMTALDEQAGKINALGRAFRVWEEKNRALGREGLIKLPKKLYRGIRNQNLHFSNELIDRELGRNELDVQLHQLRKAVMLDNSLADFSHSEILSFTANRTIAEYFTRQEGYVLEIDPSDVSVVSAWCSDAALSGKDGFNGKEEREWILRVGDYSLKPENIINYTDDIAWLSRDVRGIEMINTNSVRAYYNLNGKPIECVSHWNNAGNKATLYFRKKDEKYASSYKRSEFKKMFGFDPLPSDKDTVDSLEFYRYERYSGKSDEYIPIMDVEAPIDKALKLK